MAENLTTEYEVNVSVPIWKVIGAQEKAERDGWLSPLYRNVYDVWATSMDVRTSVIVQLEAMGRVEARRDAVCRLQYIYGEQFCEDALIMEVVEVR